MDTRSGFKKRSKSRSYLIGSILVIQRQYATTEPAADPLPGPTETSIFLASLIKSSTIKKYPGYPVFLITSNSKLSRSFIDSVISPYRFFAPIKVMCFK